MCARGSAESFARRKVPSHSLSPGQARREWKPRSPIWCSRALACSSLSPVISATVSRLEVEWGRACDPDKLRQALAAAPTDIVALVHAETSTGVLNPIQQLAA